MELNLTRDVKGYKKDFCKYTEDKRKTRENVHPLISEMGDPVARAMGWVSWLNPPAGN